MTAAVPLLSAVPSTLRIPLTARALGHRLFPDMAVDDHYAAAALSRIGDDGSQWLKDRQSIYGTLARIRCLRQQALSFIAKHPTAHVLNLGCGLSDYRQWLDNGQIRMTDADLPEVMQIRRDIMPAEHARHILADLDLNQPDWWDSLGLPSSHDEAPVFLMCEGVFMYLQATTVNALLATFGQRAPAGSLFTFDATCWMAVGRGRHHPSLKHTKADFSWGPRKIAELTHPHPNLTLLGSQGVMSGFNLGYKLLQPTFKMIFGIPLYAVYTLGINT